MTASNTRGRANRGSSALLCGTALGGTASGGTALAAGTVPSGSGSPLRARAASRAAAALAVADELGAAPFAEQVRMLIQRARLDLPVADDHEPDPLAGLGVTPREADVLALLAGGLTNRQIGESLFISEKTASVHVTNLLRKLSVSSRLEAAAIAQSLGLR